MVERPTFFGLQIMEKHGDDFMIDIVSKLTISLLILVVVGYATGCNGNQKQLGEDNNNLSTSQVHTSMPIHQAVSKQTKEKIITKDEISDVKAVNTDLVALKVDNFDRLQLKKIEETAKTEVEKNYPNHKVFLSTDKKLFWELEQLEEKLQKDNMNMKN